MRFACWIMKATSSLRIRCCSHLMQEHNFYLKSLSPSAYFRKIQVFHRHYFYHPPPPPSNLWPCLPAHLLTSRWTRVRGLQLFFKLKCKRAEREFPMFQSLPNNINNVKVTLSCMKFKYTKRSNHAVLKIICFCSSGKQALFAVKIT